MSLLLLKEDIYLSIYLSLLFQNLLEAFGSTLIDTLFRSRLKDKVELPSDWEEIAKRAPKDDVWFRKYYMTPSYSFSEAIELHRQLASVEMQDNVDGLVFIDAQLDHTTKKKVNFSLEEICLSYLQFLSRGRSGVLKSAYCSPEEKSKFLFRGNLFELFTISFKG